MKCFALLNETEIEQDCVWLTLQEKPRTSEKPPENELNQLVAWNYLVSYKVAYIASERSFVVFMHLIPRASYWQLHVLLLPQVIPRK